MKLNSTVKRLGIVASIAVAGMGLSLAAHAELTVGATLTITGPASGLGVPMRQGLELWPSEIAGEKINLVILDDGGDPSLASRNARKFVTENKVDLLIGSNTTPTAMAVASIAQESGTPHFAFAPMPMAPGKTDFSFGIPQSVDLMAAAVAYHMKEHDFKRIGFIGFSDPWGEQWLAALNKNFKNSDVKIVAEEKYGRADTSVTGQVLKLIAARPDAIFIAGSGTGAALPQTALAERNYKGQIYQSHGAGSAQFLRIAGKAAEGAILPIGPVLLPRQLHEFHPSKNLVIEFNNAFTTKYGADAGVVFGAHAFDVVQILKYALPIAKAKAQPGTPEFHAALLAAIETTRGLAGANGVYNYSPTDHYGLDGRGAVMVRVKNGDWEVVAD